jgi:hypothetical protein
VHDADAQAAEGLANARTFGLQGRILTLTLDDGQARRGNFQRLFSFIHI